MQTVPEQQTPTLPRLTAGRVAIGLVVLAAVGLVGGYGVAMRARPKPVSLELASPSPGPDAAKRRIYVHVSGAVFSPGLYALRDGARVDDAIRAAGGMTPDGDLDALNLALKLKDGDKVLVARRGAPGSGGSGEAGQQKLVNVNTATAAELDTLPGIGPAYAKRIIDYREKHGPFRTIDDLMKVPGIGPAKLEALRDLVMV